MIGHRPGSPQKSQLINPITHTPDASPMQHHNAEVSSGSIRKTT